jgi:site-specific recombinase XerD
MRIIPAGAKTSASALLDGFQNHLAKRDLAPATIRVYLHDLTVFQNWLDEVYDVSPPPILQTGTAELVAFRQYLLKEKSQRPATVNRRIQSLRLFFRWLQEAHDVDENPAEHLRYVRYARRPQPVALNRQEVIALLNAAANSSHGMAKRNSALVQLMLQTGLRVGEVATLCYGDIDLGARSGWVRVQTGKGLKFRQVPLNVTARRTLQDYLETLGKLSNDSPIFFSKRKTPLSVRAVQNLITALSRRAQINRISVSAHTLRHTFAANYLKTNPGKLVELADLMGHESLDTTAIYTRPSQADLSNDLERSALNILAE